MPWYDNRPALAPEIERMDREQLRTAQGTTAPPPAIGQCQRCADLESRLTAANERIKHLEADVRRLSGPLGIDTMLLNQQ